MAFGERPTQADLDAMRGVYDRYFDQVAINKHALDDELAEQAVKYRDVTEAVADTISYHNAAKDYFDQIEAECARAIREAHEAAYANEPKAPRLTDTAVNEQVRLDPRWQDAKDLRRTWEDMLTRLTKLEDVYKQRSSNMKELPVLFAAGYWQANSSDGRTRNERQADRVRQELNERRDLAAQQAPASPRRRPRD